MQRFFQDLRYALRTLRKSPGLTTVIVLSLALGIGANTAIFSVVNALLLKPLPYPDPDRLAILWLRSPGLGIPQDWPSPGEYIDVKTGNHVFSETAIAIGDSYNLTRGAQVEHVEGIETSSSLFQMLGAKPLLGRTLAPEEDKPGKPKTVVLTYGLWKRVFGGDPQVVGQSVNLNGLQYTVVGVLGSDFLLNTEIMPTVASISKIEIFLPLALPPNAQQDRGNENFNVLARLKPGVTVRQAQADIDVIAAHIRQVDKRDRTFTISVVPLLDQVVGNVRQALLVLLGSVALVLLIACANVANLLLSRASGRQQEVAIRTALGAGRARLIRQMLTESVTLGLCGGAAGILVAWWAVYVLRAIHPGNIPRLDAIGIDGGVLLFTLGVSALTGIAFGLAPAFRVSRVDLNTSLRAGGRTSHDEGGLGSSRHRLRGLLVVGELALSLILLVGAGLLIRSFVSLQSVSPGFNPDHVISMRISARGPKYRPDPVVAQFYEELTRRVKQLPGVQSVGATEVLPLTPAVGWGGIQIEGYTPPPTEPELQVDLRMATPGYFNAMQVPLLKGRFFDDHDTQAGMQVVIVDEKMANRFWPRGDAVGKRLKFPSPKQPWRTIVGVVGIVKQYGLDVEGKMVTYFPHQQMAANTMYLVARTKSDPESLASPIAREIHAMDPDVPVYEVAAMNTRLRDSLARQRFSTTMLGAFAAFALILAAIGIYGVLSYLVTQGTRDIGVRVALGAQPRDILGLVLRQGMSLAGMGIAAGLIGAFLLTRLMASLLFGVSAKDPITFALVALLLAAIALLACYIPARRAIKVDPLAALRYE